MPDPVAWSLYLSIHCVQKTVSVYSEETIWHSGKRNFKTGTNTKELQGKCEQMKTTSLRNEFLKHMSHVDTCSIPRGTRFFLFLRKKSEKKSHIIMWNFLICKTTPGRFELPDCAVVKGCWNVWCRVRAAIAVGFVLSRILKDERLWCGRFGRRMSEASVGRGR